MVMGSVHLPLSITYDTRDATPIGDIIAALQATDAAVSDAVSLLPSFVDGLRVESVHLSVQQLTQESPLRELFLVALFIAFQDGLEAEVPTMLEDIFRVNIPDSYDTLVTLVTVIVIFYGAAFVKDVAVKASENGAIRRQLNSLISELSAAISKPEDEIRDILAARFGKPAPANRLVKTVRGFFRPAKREGASAISFDRKSIPSDVVREVPYPEEVEEKEDLEKYESHSGVTLEIHAQDKDKANTGWAAVPRGITERRLKMRLIEPVSVSDIWTKDEIVGDITIVSKATADGFVPSEIHLNRVV